MNLRFVLLASRKHHVDDPLTGPCIPSVVVQPPTLRQIETPHNRAPVHHGANHHALLGSWVFELERECQAPQRLLLLLED